MEYGCKSNKDCWEIIYSSKGDTSGDSDGESESESESENEE